MNAQAGERAALEIVSLQGSWKGYLHHDTGAEIEIRTYPRTKRRCKI